MILFKKTLRTMRANKKAYGACILLIAVGITIYVAMGISVTQLETNQQQYYLNYNLADAFAQLNAVPASAENTLRRIDGVTDVALRKTYEARVDMPDNPKIITMRLISLPKSTDAANNPPLNAIYRNDGAQDFNQDNDIWVDSDFLTMHNLKVGDSLTLIINGRAQQMNICGTANSPDYVYIIKTATEILPDPETFSIAYMPDSAMMRLTGNNTYNEASFALSPQTQFEDIRPLLEDALQPYGIYALYPRKDLLSHVMLDTEISSAGSMATTIPAVFVMMAIAILYLMLNRVIEQERSQIGTMKAFGYSTADIIGHYMLYGVITGFIGSLIGIIVGYLLSGILSSVFDQFFKMPDMGQFSSHITRYLVKGLLIGICGGAAGALMGARKIVRLTPAEAMRPEAPKPIKKDILNYLPKLRRLLATPGLMAMRSIQRSKLRSCFVLAGITFSYGLLAFMGSYDDMIDVFMMDQYTKIQLYDMKVDLGTPVYAETAINDMSRVNGVHIAEPLLETPVTLRNNHLKEGMILTGIPAGSSLYHIYDNEEKVKLQPSKNGLILTAGLANKLDVRAGSLLTVIRDEQNPSQDFQLPVIAVIASNLGDAAYMEFTALSAAMDLPDVATSVIFRTTDTQAVINAIKNGENITAIEDVATTLRSYREFLAPYGAMIVVMEVMAVIVAVAIIMNVSIITLSERKREYATLRVLGMHPREVASIMAFEYWLLCAFSILIGIPFTALLKNGVASAMDAELFTFPTATPLSAHIIAGVGCIIAVAISNNSARRNIASFDMVETLKERE